MLENAVYSHFKNKHDEKEPEKQPSKGKGKEKDNSLDEASPVLNFEEEAFLATLIDDDEHRPPLPPRIITPHLSIHSSDDEPTSPLPAPASASPKKSRLPAFLFAERPATEADDEAKSRRARVAALFRRGVDSIKTETSTALTLYLPQTTAAATEAATEAGVGKQKDDLDSVLEDLNMGAKGNTAFSLSKESAELTHKFNQVLRDLIEGGPTAYKDLTHLLDDRDNALGRAYDKLPSSMKRMVESLLEKITGSLGPEVLVAAAEAGGIKIALDSAQAKSGKKGAAKKAMRSGAMSLLTPGNLQKMITKPGALVSMLKAIVTALKTRWPVFISTNILFSVSVFLLLIVLWYCHKRGREQRLERENRVDGSGRVEEIVEWEIEEVEDDDAPKHKDQLLLPPPNPRSPKGSDSPRPSREQARQNRMSSPTESSGSRSLKPRRRRRREENTDEDESDRDREEERERRWEREKARYYREKERGDDDRSRDSGGRRDMNRDRDRDHGRSGDRDRDGNFDRRRDGSRDRRRPDGSDDSLETGRERRRRRRARDRDQDLDDGKGQEHDAKR